MAAKLPVKPLTAVWISDVEHRPLVEQPFTGGRQVGGDPASARALS